MKEQGTEAGCPAPESDVMKTSVPNNKVKPPKVTEKQTGTF